MQDYNLRKLISHFTTAHNQCYNFFHMKADTDNHKTGDLKHIKERNLIYEYKFETGAE